MGINGRQWSKCKMPIVNSLTMSAGVLPVIVKVFPVLGKEFTHTHTLTHSHTHTLTLYKNTNISSLSFPLLKAVTHSSKQVVVVGFRAGNTNVFPVTRCLSPQSQHWGIRGGLQHFFLSIAQPCRWSFPAQMGKFGSRVNVSGICCRPEGLLRPSEHQEYPASEKVPTPCEKPNTVGTSGHGAFSSLAEKEQIIIRKVTGYRPEANSNASAALYKKRVTRWNVSVLLFKTGHWGGRC